MNLKGEIIKHNLKFKFDAGTSRGILKEKASYFLKVYAIDNPYIFGIGECAPLQGLSIDWGEGIEKKLSEILLELADFQKPQNIEQAYQFAHQLAGETYPSIRFALEVAFLDLMHEGRRKIFQNSFSEGKTSIPINGLIWMGSKDFMLDQVQQKIKEGYSCIKLKIGAIDFETECSILQSIREKYPPDQIELRVDANGAFSIEEAPLKLKKLSLFQIHSIEQPVAAGQQEALGEICRNSPIPVALDEELIGVYGNNKEALLNTINPHYIILKPTLLGGLQETDEWIKIASKRNMNWWLTSALESNIGLNAICQFTAEYKNPLPQGLGTGQLYHNNIDAPLEISKGHIFYNKNRNWQLNKMGV